MKKLLLLGALIAFGANAATMAELEQRIEDLEFKSYENYTKITGDLEYRFDSTRTEFKDNVTTFNSSAQAFTTFNKDRTVGAGYESIFFGMNIESNPTDKLSFYGRLSAAKYVNVLNSSGTATEDAAFNDLSRGSVQSTSALFLERAFFNYKFNKSFTLTMGRLPTSQGAPRHFTEGSTRKGNYPILAFGGNWDGAALTYNLGDVDSVKLVYTPVSTINFNQTISETISDASGDSVDSKIPAYTFLYEREKANTLGSRNFYFIASYFTMKDMPTLPATNSDLYLSLDRVSFYTELSGVAGSKFDVALHAVHSTTKSEGHLTLSTSPLIQYGWLTNEDSDEKTGTAWGILTRYALTNNTKIGYEYFTGSKDVFLYDSVNQDGISPYTTLGDMHHVFINHKFGEGFKVVVGHMLQNSSHYRSAFTLLGESQEADVVNSNTYARFITAF